MIHRHNDHKSLEDLVRRQIAAVYRAEPGPDGKFTYFNEALEEITGYSKDELESMPVSTLYPRPEDRRLFEEEIKLAGFVRAKQLRIRNKQGDSRYVEVTVIAYKDEATDDILYYDGIALDVTDKVEMYRTVSHQISTPVLGIMHNAQSLLQRNHQDAKRQLLLKSILGSSNVALFLTRNLSYMSSLLDISHEAFSRNLVSRPIAPILFKMVIDLQSYALQEKGIRINIEEKSLNELPNVMIDETAFMMEVFCILDNAIKYSYEDSTIQISCMVSKQFTSVLVQNEGIPLMKEHLPPTQPNIFTKQYRAPDAEAFVPTGAGLGLYIASRIMQLHGGKVFVEPSQKYTTVFRLAFPISGISSGGLR